MAETIFQLNVAADGLFDGSKRGIAVIDQGGAKLDPQRNALHMAEAPVRLAPSASLQELEAFTIEATVTPAEIEGEGAIIAESEAPAISLRTADAGRVVAEIMAAGKRVRLDSGDRRLVAEKEQMVRLERDADGTLSLAIDGDVVAKDAAPGPLTRRGDAGFSIGGGRSGQAFRGTIGGFQILDGHLDRAAIKAYAARETKLTSVLRQQIARDAIRVHVVPDETRARLQPAKELLATLGVERLSDLETLRIAQRTVMTPQKVMMAPRRRSTPKIDWRDRVKVFRGANAGLKSLHVAEMLPNRNSVGTLKKVLAASAASSVSTGAGSAATLRETAMPFVAEPALASGSATVARPTAGAFARRNRPVLQPNVGLPTRVLTESETLRRPIAESTIVADHVAFSPQRLTLDLKNRQLPAKLESDAPADWPTSGNASIRLMSTRTIPIGTAVIIAQTLDLTNAELVIEPDVTKLYIIAEEVRCGPNARITWRQPGGTTPARPDNGDLNGRGYTGIHTSGSSRNGLHGEDGRNGVTGLGGAEGRSSPSLEMWVKAMTAMPNIDLEGEDGRKGGRGQRGGRGGRGANGRGGRKTCFIKCWCSTDAGHGGDGGDGGDGGRGGRGGNGGDGGRLAIGVLDGTLEGTVTARAFRLKNAGGRAGRGGDGGEGGSGGGGGRSGNGKHCKNARNGHAGARGQRGREGSDGTEAGGDGDLDFFEFSENAWTELLDRPWLSDLDPSEGFPGDNITLRGSRFDASDRVFVGGSAVAATLALDESLRVDIPATIAGGPHDVFVRRSDGTDSNRLTLNVKPRLDVLPASLPPGGTVTLRGAAFQPGAAVLVDGGATDATVTNRTQLSFEMPGTGGGGSSGGTVSIQVRNPDGFVSNARSAQRPSILEIPFRYGVHNLSFDNFTDGVPSWGTFEDTFGTAEVWHELLDPIFGHPVLTTAYYIFYEEFLKGRANGGLATGFCTSLASLVADRFWTGEVDTPALTKAPLHRDLTAIHGKLLSRESLIHFHDQGRQGLARVVRSYRDIEATFLRGCDRHNMPLLFFIPSGAAWDEGYFDRLSDSHCIMPYRFVYPTGRQPALAPTAATTTTDPDGVEMYCWDCNEPTSTDCKVVFRRDGSDIHFDYLVNGTSKFASTDGITLGVMTNGAYRLADHDLPFGGPFGLTRFVLDFLLSPAELQVTDALGRRTGNFAGQILAEIPDSHPCYLVPHAYMLPEATALNREIVGRGNGTYTYNTVLPVGSSTAGGCALSLAGVPTAVGSTDTMAINADATQARFSPTAAKPFDLTMSRLDDGRARAFTVNGLEAAPGAELDLAMSPDLSMVRVGNRGAARSVQIKAFTVDRSGGAPVRQDQGNVSIPANHDIALTVSDWDTLDLQVDTLAIT